MSARRAGLLGSDGCHSVRNAMGFQQAMRNQKQPTAVQERSAKSPGLEERVIVRPFILSDLQRITQIEAASFPVDAFSTSEFLRLYTAYPDEFLVADIDGEVVGYVAGSVRRDFGEIESLAVDQRLRGRGIGSMLTRRLLARFQQMGLERCVLQVRITNILAVNLYERLGFRIVRTLGAYYADGGDAFLMEKTLGAERASAAELD